MKLFVKLSLIALMSFSWGAFAAPKEVTVDFSGPVPFVPPPGSNYSDSILVDPSHRIDLSCYQSVNGGGFTLMAQCPIINNALAMYSSTWAPFSSIANTLSFSPQATSLSFVISGTVGPKSLYERNLLTVNVVLNNSTILRYDFNNPSAIFSYPITISKPDGISVAGITVLYNRNVGGTIGDPGYYYHTGISTITWATDVAAKAELIAEVLNTPTKIQDNITVATVAPSIYGCGVLEKTIVEKSVRILCRNTVTKELLENCAYRTNLARGPYDGGHSKVHKKPIDLGSLNPQTSNGMLVIPKEGAIVKMSMPEIAGEIDLNISGRDPLGTSINANIIRFQVKSSDYIRLDGLNITFDVNGSNSHAEGVYGTSKMKMKLTNMLEKFEKGAKDKGFLNPPRLESEAASLPWGGIYDTKLDWQNPHCGHRNGKTLDLSLSIFDAYPEKSKKTLKTILAAAVISSGFQFPIESEAPLKEPEVPADPKDPPEQEEPDHWHIVMK